MKSLLAE